MIYNYKDYTGGKRRQENEKEYGMERRWDKNKAY